MTGVLTNKVLWLTSKVKGRLRLISEVRILKLFYIMKAFLKDFIQF